MSSLLVLIALLITLACGLVFCFRGLKWMRIVIAIYAFWLGASTVYNWVAPYGAGASWPWWAAGAAGLLLVILSYVFEKLAFFITGGLLGIAVYRLVAAFNPVFFGSLPSGMSFLIGVIFFLIFGFAAVSARKFVLIAATSIWGAYTTVTSAGIIIGMLISPPSGYLPAFTSLGVYERFSVFASLPAAVPVACIIVLAVAGILVQRRRI
ncbi:MAG: DUF4203 domain-containing protein [Clostridia bacterium]|nr:DUF4203 domain-containing protein [Clostridia bacterium]